MKTFIVRLEKTDGLDDMIVIFNIKYHFFWLVFLKTVIYKMLFYKMFSVY